MEWVHRLNQSMNYIEEHLRMGMNGSLISQRNTATVPRRHLTGRSSLFTG